VRLNLAMDYDMLLDQANNHKSLRGILGVYQYGLVEGKTYKLSTIKHNVRLLDEETLKKISELVVKAGHQLKKKEENSKQPLKLKTDTYAVESNIHFPTDLNLLWDSVRVCARKLNNIITSCGDDISEWRKESWWSATIKSNYRKTSEIHRKKGKNYEERLRASTKDYVRYCKAFSKKIKRTYDTIMELEKVDFLKKALATEMLTYQNLIEKHIDLVERRILKGETIPHSDKLFSIFEQHVEWLQKGKANKKVELGHNLLLTTDQYHFIVDHHVAIKEVDKALLIPLVDRLVKNYPASCYEFYSLSTDRGFYTLLGKKKVKEIFKIAVIPKKGKKTATQELEEQSKIFVKHRKSHSAVEANINELEHGGLNKVRDKTLPGFKKYVAYGVLAYNIKRLGKILIQQQVASNKKQYRKKAA